METNNNEKVMVVPQVSRSQPQLESGNAKNALKKIQRGKKDKNSCSAVSHLCKMCIAGLLTPPKQAPNPELLYPVLPFLLVTVCAVLCSPLRKAWGSRVGVAVAGLIKHEV